MDSHTLASFNRIVFRKVDLNYFIVGGSNPMEPRCPLNQTVTLLAQSRRCSNSGPCLDNEKSTFVTITAMVETRL